MHDFPAYKKALMAQGRSFCSVTAPQCREKIAALAVDFIQDDSTVRSLPSGNLPGLINPDPHPQLFAGRGIDHIESS